MSQRNPFLDDEPINPFMEGENPRDALRKKVIDNLTSGFFDRPRQRLMEDAGSLVKGIAGSVIRGIPATFDQLKNNPPRGAKNIEAGIGGIIPNIANTFLNIPQWLAHLESNRASDFLKNYTPQIPVEKYQEKYVGGETSQSDKEVRDFFGNLPLMIPIGKGVAKSVVPVTKSLAKGTGAISNKLTFNTFPGKTDPILEANEIQLELRGKNKEAEVEQKTAEAQTADEAYKQAVAQSKQEVGKSDADLMQYNIDKRQQEIQNLTDETSNLKNQLSEIKPEENALPQAEENLNTAQLAHQNVESLNKNINDNIGQYLNKDAAHDVRAAKLTSNRVNAIEDYANESYKTFLQNIQDAEFHMPKSAMDKLDYDSMSPTQLIRTFGADAFESLKKGKISEFLKKQKDIKEDNPYLQSIMEVAPTVSDTNAANFLAKYKDFRDRVFRLGQRLKDPRVEEVEKQKIEGALKQGRQMLGQMKEVLDSGLGEFKPEFDLINKLYSEQVYPLRENPVVQKAHEGKLSDNIIKSIRTDEPGMPLVREIVKQDPEILRNIVGQRYFSKPNEIHSPNELMREFLDEMPQLKQLLSERETTNAALEQAKANAETAKQHHAEMISRETESVKIQKKIDEMSEEIDKHKADIPRIEKHIKKLQETSKKKSISLKEKMRVEKELKDLKRELKDTTSKLDSAVTGLRKYLRMAKTAYRIGRKVI